MSDPSSSNPGLRLSPNPNLNPRPAPAPPPSSIPSRYSAWHSSPHPPSSIPSRYSAWHSSPHPPTLRLLVIVLVLVSLRIPGVLPAFAAPPPNDDFAHRAPLAGTFASDSGTLAEATFETAEPDLGPSPGQTLWWTWTAPADGLALFWGSGSCPGASCAPAIAVFTGNELPSLQRVATNAIATRCRNWAGGVCLFSSTELEDTILVPVKRGTPYQLRLDHASATVGTDRFDFGVQFFGLTLASPSDHTAVVEGTPLRLVLTPIPTDVIGIVDAVTIYGRNNDLVAVLRPPDFRALWTPPGPGDYPLVALATNRDGAVHFSPTVNLHVGPANDFFDRRVVLNGFGGRFHADVSVGTPEADEPFPAGAGRRSLWWTWTALDSGQLMLDARGNFAANPEFSGAPFSLVPLAPPPPAPSPQLHSIDICCGGFDPAAPARVGPLVSVYTGDSLTRLVRVASNSIPSNSAPPWAITNHLSLPVYAGTTYQIAIDGVNGSTGIADVDLELRQTNGRPTLKLATESGPEGLRLRLDGVPGTPYSVSSSPDLREWSTFASGTFPASGTVSVRPPPPTLSGLRFFRAARP